MASHSLKRILIKVSGEALAGDNSFGIEPEFLDQVAKQLWDLSKSGLEVAIVVGGGNIFRGMAVAAGGADRVVGDHMGMLATVINSLALGDAIKRCGGQAKVYSNIAMPAVADTFTVRDARRALAEGKITICAGGSGNPFFTTDTAAALKAVELQCDALFKGTQVDGVYSADPKQVADAERYDRISYDDVIANDLKVMDMAAFALARDNNLPIYVYQLDVDGGVRAVIDGTAVSTLVTGSAE
ncbi:UMP kinase [Maritalea porphyrae]|uniref:Uridylate kinase n=1 Tax=Maritalea porphyrae TaxID=880732 RepID=A0ABQ5UUX8_9HYPH|nr:UMP kinase [Maritalea porphyrae]GLQ18497.1 uridylate kinase [Maritalea porphyrae]